MLLVPVALRGPQALAAPLRRRFDARMARGPHLLRHRRTGARHVPHVVQVQRHHLGRVLVDGRRDGCRASSGAICSCAFRSRIRGVELTHDEIRERADDLKRELDASSPAAGRPRAGARVRTGTRAAGRRLACSVRLRSGVRLRRMRAELRRAGADRRLRREPSPPRSASGCCSCGGWRTSTGRSACSRCGTCSTCRSCTSCSRSPRCTSGWPSTWGTHGGRARSGLGARALDGPDARHRSSLAAPASCSCADRATPVARPAVARTRGARGRGQVPEVPRARTQGHAGPLPLVPQADRRSDPAEEGCAPGRDGRLRPPATSSTPASTPSLRPFDPTHVRPRGGNRVPPGRPARGDREELREVPQDAVVPRADAGLRHLPRRRPQAEPRLRLPRAATRRPCRSRSARSRFDHSKAAFQLTGAHRTVACAKCHVNQVFKGLKFAQCTDCHKSPHRQPMGNACTSCHTNDSWKTQRVDHARTAFPLRGKHAEVACAKCHTRPPLQAALKFDRCADCHQDPHRGAFKQDCSGCHNESGFGRGTVRPRDRHAVRADRRARARSPARSATRTRQAPAAGPGARRRLPRAGDGLRVVPQGRAQGELGTACETCHTPSHVPGRRRFNAPAVAGVLRRPAPGRPVRECHVARAPGAPARTGVPVDGWTFKNLPTDVRDLPPGRAPRPGRHGVRGVPPRRRREVRAREVQRTPARRSS